MTEVKELRQLRDQNARLKRLVADVTLDKHILSEVCWKTCMNPPRVCKRASSEGAARRSAKMYPAY
jgi:hypothetical protein